MLDHQYNMMSFNSLPLFHFRDALLQGMLKTCGFPPTVARSPTKTYNRQYLSYLTKSQPI